MNATFKIGQHEAFDDPSWIEAPPFVRNFTQLFLSRVATSGDKDALYEKRLGL